MKIPIRVSLVVGPVENSAHEAFNYVEVEIEAELGKNRVNKKKLRLIYGQWTINRRQ